MNLSRVWAMADPCTFNVPEIELFVKKYLRSARLSCDPFARNKRWATLTNDLNPATAADQHLEAEAFLQSLQPAYTGRVDLMIFDPPYSPTQLRQCYGNIGRAWQRDDALTGKMRRRWRQAALPLLTADAVVLSFGWNSVGFGKVHGFEIIEIMLVCHGSDHNDTICLAERRVQPHPELFQ